jgi:hypothetical protein
MSTKVNELYKSLEKLIEQGYGDCDVLPQNDYGFIDGVGELEVGLLVNSKKYNSLEFYSFDSIEQAKTTKEEELLDYHKRLLEDIEDDQGETVITF